MTILEQLLIKAHADACLRDNSSTVILKSTFDSNGCDLIKSITAALMAVGGMHAPIKHAYNMIRRAKEYGVDAPEGAPDYTWVPGFGSSFVKGSPDPLLEDLANQIYNNHYQFYEIGENIRTTLCKKKKTILYPNLAFYTACVAHILEERLIFCERIFIEARIPAWIKILQKNYES